MWGEGGGERGALTVFGEMNISSSYVSTHPGNRFKGFSFQFVFKTSQNITI